MKLREARQPWANVSQRRLRELGAAVGYWERLGSSIWLPWFVGDRCTTGRGMSGVLMFIGVSVTGAAHGVLHSSRLRPLDH
jgi:hypothetical protein